MLTLEYPDGSRKVVHPTGGFQSGCDDGGRRDKVVGKGVVEVALHSVASARSTRIDASNPLCASNCSNTGKSADRMGARSPYLELEDVLHAVELVLVPATQHQSAKPPNINQLSPLRAPASLSCSTCDPDALLSSSHNLTAPTAISLAVPLPPLPDTGNPPAERQGKHPYLALNSSKLSSACSFLLATLPWNPAANAGLASAGLIAKAPRAAGRRTAPPHERTAARRTGDIEIRCLHSDWYRSSEGGLSCGGTRRRGKVVVVVELIV